MKKSERKELTKLNQIKPSQLTLSDKLKQAILTKKLNEQHFNKSKKRVDRIKKKLIPLSIGKKLMEDYHISSYKAFKAMYRVTTNPEFARFQRKPTKSSQNTYLDN